MAFTAQQITDLDNSMVAAQNVSLGTMLSALVATSASQAISGSAAGLKFAYGTATPNAASFNVATGLTTVLGVNVSISGSPIATHTSSTSFVSSGSIIIKNWVISGSTVTAAASTFADVHWMAVGV